MANKFDRAKDLQKKRDQAVSTLKRAQAALYMISYEDELLMHEWRERGDQCAAWGEEVASHCNALIDSVLRSG